MNDKSTFLTIPSKWCVYLLHLLCYSKQYLQTESWNIINELKSAPIQEEASPFQLHIHPSVPRNDRNNTCVTDIKWLVHGNVLYFQLYKDIKKDAHGQTVKDAGLIIQSSIVYEIHSSTGCI